MSGVVCFQRPGRLANCVRKAPARVDSRGLIRMKAALNKWSLSIIVTIILAPAAFGQIQLPDPKGMINDFAGKLSDGTRQSIESLLERFRDQSGIEVTVATVKFDDLQGYPIEQYALELGRKWGVGRD